MMAMNTFQIRPNKASEPLEDLRSHQPKKQQSRKEATKSQQGKPQTALQIRQMLGKMSSKVAVGRPEGGHQPSAKTRAAARGSSAHGPKKEVLVVVQTQPARKQPQSHTSSISSLSDTKGADKPSSPKDQLAYVKPAPSSF
jgi:hypothetical protein